MAISPERRAILLALEDTTDYITIDNVVYQETEDTKKEREMMLLGDENAMLRQQVADANQSLSDFMDFYFANQPTA